MKVVLTKNIKGLGKLGEIVTVKLGYAANFLLPSGGALYATESNMVHFEKERSKYEEEQLKETNDLDILAGKIKALAVVIEENSSEDGKLYGSVTARNIVNFYADNNIKISPTDIGFEEKVSTVGSHKILFNLGHGVEFEHELSVVGTNR
jgi:large subunit ribosomal protein L9